MMIPFSLCLDTTFACRYPAPRSYYMIRREAAASLPYVHSSNLLLPHISDQSSHGALLPTPYPANYHLYPHLLEFAPANLALIILCASGELSITIGLARHMTKYMFKRRMGGLCMRTAAICAAILLPLDALISINQAQRSTQSGSVASKKRAFCTNLSKVDIDD